MNDVVQTIFDRNSCRHFSPAPLQKDQVETLVKTALAAPSAVNRQPWHIIALTNKALIEEMDQYMLGNIQATNPDWYAKIVERGGKIFYDSPCLIVVATDGSDYAPIDAGIAVQNMALAAHSMGLGSVICGMARAAFEGERGEEFKSRLQFPAGYGFGMSICVGTVLTDKEPHPLDFAKATYID